MIAECADYSPETLRGVSTRIWDGFPAVRGCSVFIKPNLVTPPTGCDSASCTHVEVTRMVIRKVLEGKPSRVVVGDCGFKNQWECTMESSGYCSLAEEFGKKVDVVALQDGPNFHRFTLVRFPKGGKYMSLYGARISEFVLQCDMIIDVPKLKVHSMAGITGAIKNLMGVMTQKGSMHPRGSIEILHKRLRDLYFLLRPRVKFCLMDGVVGSEYCEQAGVPVNTGLLLSDPDPWRLDCVAAEVMGIAPGGVPYLKYIQNDLGQAFPAMKRPRSYRYERPLAWR